MPKPPQYELDLDGIFEPIVNILRASLLAKFKTHLVNIFIHADRELVNWGMTKGGLPILYEGPPVEEAIKWAEKHGAQLVTKMDEETKRRLAKVVADAIENKRGIPGLARDISNEFADMSKYRSNLIARTETAKALRTAGRERMVDMGVTGHEWILGSGGEEGNCDDCIANAAVGAIPIDQEFPNPEDSIHPQCTCATAPVMLRK